MNHYRLLFAAIMAVFSLGLSAQDWTGNEAAEGDFYLYNVGQQKWLTSGNSWGTQATLTPTGGFQSTLELSDGKYAIKNPETRTNNKVGGPGYLGTNGFMDGESAAYFTFTPADRTDGVTAYYIQNDGQNLQYSGSGTVVSFGTGTGDDAQWVLVTRQDRLDAMANATSDRPVDATFLLKNPDFGRYKLNFDSWVWTFPGTENKNNAGDNTNFCVESYHAAFDFCQTIEDAPYGTYGVKGQAFYRQDGDNNEDLPYFYVNDGQVTFPLKTGSENSMNAASASFSAGNYETGEARTSYEGGTLQVGAHLDNNTALWCIWDNIQLYYYGQPSDPFEIYKADLQKAVEAAEALDGTIPSAAYSDLADIVSQYDKTYSSAEDYTDAINTIKDATKAAQALQKEFNRYKDVRDAVLDVSASVNTSSADTQADAATTVEAIEEAVAAVRLALVNELPNITVADGDSIDLTAALIDNPTVRKNTDYWTKEGTPNTSYSWAVVNYEETEFYQQNFKFFQNIVLGKGTYSLGVTGFHRAGNHSTYFYAGDDKVLIPGVESSVVNTMAAAKDYFDEGNGKVYLKFVLEDEENDIQMGIVNTDTQTDKWTIFRDFTLRYFGAKVDLSIYEDAWAEAVAAAEAALADDANANVTGGERGAVLAAEADAPEQTKASYIEKTDALNTAVQAFKAAAAAYDAYQAEKAVAEMIGSDVAAEPSSAEEALAAVQEMKVGEYNYVDAQYTYDKSDFIGDLSTWNGTATVNGETAEPGTDENQHWSGNSKTYYEQASAGWGASVWTLLYETTATLPVGDFVLKVAARASAAVSGKVSCSETSNTAVLPHQGASTKGIDTAGAANFGDGDFANEGNGYGWEWVFLPFTVSEEKEVTFSLSSESNSQYQWVSLCDVSLLCKDNVTTGITTVGTEKASVAKDIFNLQGQKVTKAQKGVFIQNGKKIVVK